MLSDIVKRGLIRAFAYEVTHVRMRSKSAVPDRLPSDRSRKLVFLINVRSTDFGPVTSREWGMGIDNESNQVK